MGDRAHRHRELGSAWPRSRRRYVMSCFVASLLAVAIITNALPATNMQAAVLQEALLAPVVGMIAWRAIGLGGLRFAADANEGERKAKGRNSTNANSHNGQTHQRGRAAVVGTAGLLLAAGFLGGATSFLVSAPSIEYALQPLPARIVLALTLCLLTGAFEECLFRGLGFVAFRDAFAAQSLARNPLLAAALLQAVLFALLHVPLQQAVELGSAIIWTQALLKLAQATLFGLVMAALAVCTRGLWLPILLHAAFDCLYLGPGMVASGVANAQYLSGTLPDVAMLAATVLLLAAALRACGPWLQSRL